MGPQDSAVQGVLARSMIACVATISRDGVPSLTPLWFVVDRGRVLMTTGQATLAVRNIATHPAVVLLVDEEPAERSQRVLRIRGTATVRRGLPSFRQLLRIAVKYYISPTALSSELIYLPKWVLRGRMYARMRPAVIEVTPETAEFVPWPTGWGAGPSSQALEP